MNQINPFKSSLIRITLVYVLLFGLSVCFILGLIYWSTIVYTTNQTDENINAEIQALSAVYAAQGYAGLASTLSERVRQQRPGDSTLYLLTDHNFEPLVGNISGWPKVAYDQDGWLDFRLDDLLDEKSGEFSARAKTFEVDNRFNLLVGQGMKDLRNLRQLVTEAMIWSLLVTLVLGVLMGYMMRRTLRSRLMSINSISREIMQGDFQKRIKTKGSGDEFDELADNLNIMLDRIENGVEGVRRVSDNIAHDLKTPLARLKNKVEELHRVFASDSKEHQALDQIVAEADGLLATFNALLRIARIEYSEKRKEFAAVAVDSLLADLLELYEPLTEEKSQRLSAVAMEPVTVLADRDMLFQALANLIDNAIKYTPDDGQIEIALRDSPNGAFIEIADNGPGIPADEYDNVVQRFYRVDESRTTPGSGLGLALVSAVLRVHQMGLTFADNAPGLRVRVDLPKYAGPKSPRSSRRNARK